MDYINKVKKDKSIYVCNDQSARALYSQKRVKHLPRIQLIFFSERGVRNIEEIARRKMIVIFVMVKAFTVMDNLSCMCCRRLLGVQEHRN